MPGKKEEGGRKSQKHSESNDDSLLENGEIIEPDFSDPEDYVDSISDEGSVFFAVILNPRAPVYNLSPMRVLYSRSFGRSVAKAT